MVVSQAVNVGIIGTGFARRVHLPAFRADSRCNVVAICCTNEQQAAEVANQHGIAHAYSRWMELLENPRIDAVSIAVPPMLQPDIAKAALDRGKAVFCEKPMAMSVKEAARMLRTASAPQLPAMIDFEFPELPAWQHTKTMLDSGLLGEIDHVNIVWHLDYQPNKAWKATEQTGGGVLNLFVCHCLYYFEWLFDRIKTPLKSSVATHTFCQFSGELETGGTVVVEINSKSSSQHEHRIEMVGSAGSLLLENRSSDYMRGFRLFYRSWQSQAWDEIQLDEEVSNTDGRIWPVSRLVSRFITWILTGRSTHPNFHDGLRVQTLMENISSQQL